MDQNLVQQAFDFIARFEGLRLKAYQDVGGVYTVGYGATGSNIGPSTVWTISQAQDDLKSRIEALLESLMGILGLPLTDNQWCALLSFTYNVGLGGFEGSHLCKNLKAGVTDPAVITGDFMLWDHVNGQINMDLHNRRAAEAALFVN